MVKITCQNSRLKNEGPEKCDKFLVSVPEWVLSGLKMLEGEPEGVIVVQCQSCRSARFAEIKYVKGKLAFISVIKKPELGEKHKFKIVEACSEAPLIEGKEEK
jgi:hypothetical protein